MPNPQATIAAQVGRDLVPGSSTRNRCRPPSPLVLLHAGGRALDPRAAPGSPPGPGESPEDSLAAVPCTPCCEAMRCARTATSL